eukprot:CAMPEP_0198620120 /NCGR_PEP_ID=MMETSP1462-20131121/161734_1 /TAXON_ID=1333877 /ORGANISM="Brandtodinium nutriculum, Strain RCC3387" /LENGTH=137 /DNA_ID=CAMNT_0044351919 /DNA_START=876 /DNA_END=1288 /DNA_ORIENTATION=-
MFAPDAFQVAPVWTQTLPLSIETISIAAAPSFGWDDFNMGSQVSEALDGQSSGAGQAVTALGPRDAAQVLLTGLLVPELQEGQRVGIRPRAGDLASRTTAIRAQAARGQDGSAEPEDGKRDELLVRHDVALEYCRHE